MADTPRTYAQIQALFPDNTSGDISAQDLRDFVETTRGYGSLIATSVSQAGIAASATKFTEWESAGESVNMTVELANNRIVIPYAGVYKADLTVSFSDGFNIEWFIDLYKNGSIIDGARISRKLSAGGDVGSAACHAPPATYAADDYIEMYVTPSAGPQTLTIAAAALTVYRVG